MKNKFLELLANDNQSDVVVWIDSWQYCQQLFLKDAIFPWGNSSDLDGFIRKSDALLHSKVLSISLMSFFEYAIVNVQGLKLAMGDKTRTGFALKTLLRDEQARGILKQALRIVSEASSRPLVISIPTPRDLLSWAYQMAHEKPPEELSIDHVDTAGVYLSDFISALSTCDLAGVLVEENCASEKDWQEESLIYTPLRNVTKHLQWALGTKIKLSGSEDSSFLNFDFVISPKLTGNANANANANVNCGLWIADNYWSDGGEIESANFYYGVIPVSGVPEKVLESRKALGGF